MLETREGHSSTVEGNGAERRAECYRFTEAFHDCGYLQRQTAFLSPSESSITINAHSDLQCRDSPPSPIHQQLPPLIGL